MLKMPEPVAILDACVLDRSKNCCRALHCTRRVAVNTEAQLKQAVRDALEAAINCYSPDDSATDWADKIRKLMEGL